MASAKVKKSSRKAARQKTPRLFKFMHDAVKVTQRAYKDYLTQTEEVIARHESSSRDTTLSDKIPGYHGRSMWEFRNRRQKILREMNYLRLTSQALRSLEVYGVEVVKRDSVEAVYALMHEESGMQVGTIRIQPRAVERGVKRSVPPKFALNFIDPAGVFKALGLERPAGSRRRDAEGIRKATGKLVAARLADLPSAERTFRAYNQSDVHGVRIELDRGGVHVNVDCRTLTQGELVTLRGFMGDVEGAYPVKKHNTLRFRVPREQLGEEGFHSMLDAVAAHYRANFKGKKRARLTQS